MSNFRQTSLLDTFRRKDPPRPTTAPQQREPRRPMQNAGPSNGALPLASPERAGGGSDATVSPIGARSPPDTSGERANDKFHCSTGLFTDVFVADLERKVPRGREAEELISLMGKIGARFRENEASLDNESEDDTKSRLIVPVLEMLGHSQYAQNKAVSNQLDRADYYLFATQQQRQSFVNEKKQS